MERKRAEGEIDRNQKSRRRCPSDKGKNIIRGSTYKGKKQDIRRIVHACMKGLPWADTKRVKRNHKTTTDSFLPTFDPGVRRKEQGKRKKKPQSGGSRGYSLIAIPGFDDGPIHLENFGIDEDWKKKSQKPQQPD